MGTPKGFQQEESGETAFEGRWSKTRVESRRFLILNKTLQRKMNGHIVHIFCTELYNRFCGSLKLKLEGPLVLCSEKEGFFFCIDLNTHKELKTGWTCRESCFQATEAGAERLRGCASQWIRMTQSHVWSNGMDPQMAMSKTSGITLLTFGALTFLFFSWTLEWKT